MKTLYYSLLFLVFTVSCTTSSQHNVLKFTKLEYGEKWPFSVEEIEVYCSGYKEIYCKADNGKIYALNGSAKGASRNNPAISKIEEIWLDDPNWAGLKIPYGDFITKGLELCESK
ncbi:hypothetical protein ATB99_02630 [Elizabethkingia meningoseptica]|uniref:DUF2511 domain-containing protein n=1 Tax=Elizabethkingia meningoseptica TaxID=238 RepID=UPI000332C4C2|nr:DUF2511 domain-containing protein [Elizabethkingia meningoseptica]AQX05281.1 hypothetical protein BBD33_08490 [Elizabethkingia meningoseptica]AQX47324.1 hypothetical protein B5G46_08480 [Elizabethkingia meningoseptica]EOR31112.1 hypothetical protein L100_02572 [Elizabethkingia meningoseptica ATCC 13253 = NBRC 12535]KUY24412.1 hypothetical protein ATB99_02630 [Elizabethkingia meningoseptica]OPB76367.1 hypothetical protein BAY30_16025 [Elizabethkingia meningoseptica]